MSKLYFKYGCMGSSKSAQALMTRFNYLEKGRKVWLIKPKNTRDKDVTSRIGLSAEAFIIEPDANIYDEYLKEKQSNGVDVIIADESQFFSREQIDQLRYIVDNEDITVMCYGIRTDFQTNLFKGALRLLEIADSIDEIKTICKCGKKAIVNVRLDEDGNVVTDGSQIYVGDVEDYTAMCYSCWIKAKSANK